MASIIAEGCGGTWSARGRSTQHAFLVLNLVLGSLAVLAGIMIKGRRKVASIAADNVTEAG